MEFGLVALWLALYLALLLAGSVVTGWLFPRFEDYGSGVAIPLSVTVIWLVTFFVGRLSITIGIWLGVAVLAGLTLLSGSRGTDIDLRRVGETYVVFAAAFLFFVGVRVFAAPFGATDPVIAPLPLSIGEKMLDFGLLKSLLRAETLPPEDMWFAGEPVAYYYGGHLIAAILSRLTGTAGRFAYNLALSGFYAMLVTAAYGIASNVAADRPIPRRLAGGLSVFAVGIASNLSTPGRLLLAVLPDGVASPIADLLGVELRNLATGIGNFYYFDASRVISDRRADFAFQFPNAGPEATSPTINEFPFFAWFNADLHAHMMSTAFLLLAAAICLSYYRTPEREVWRRRALLVGVLPPVAGLLAVTNTWSFPTTAGLALLTVVLSPSRARSLLPSRYANHFPDTGLRREGTSIVLGIGVAIAIVILGVLWSLPFWLGPASGRTVSILPDRSSLGELLLVHGLFVAVFGAYLYGRSRQVLGDRVRRDAFAAVVVVIVGGLADFAALGLFVPLVGVSWLLARYRSDDQIPVVGSVDWIDDGIHSSDRDFVGFETVLVVAGIGLVTLVEFVYLKEGSGRMNTVFKVYMQVWVLWGVAFGPALAWILSKHFSRPSPSLGRLRPTGLRIALVVLVVSSGIYMPLAVSNNFSSQNPTIDGLTYLESEYPEEAAAIHWLDDRDGRPVVLMDAPGGYTWDPDNGEGSSAPASLTGLPTVLGWFHEAQYRGDGPYEQRLEDVETMFTGDPDEQRSLLAKYDVEYVYVGPIERDAYPDMTVTELRAVTVEKQFEGTTIYRVDQSALDG
ncbi:DUF2298 domain-containing protein [Halorhabdus amylolytica]|uniref:DUF2298 domain-containing protein n=1 Tax=Halorhabdus amylolytica TaxID=2559573 RepID=UPI0010AA4330|nr:DUF2298 domain-containing protein [Halorhabdus amylolytica]